MSVMKKSVLFKVVSIVVILSFIVLDISWAYPDISPEKLNHTLGIRGAMFQNTMSGAQPLVEIDLGRAALRGSILDIIDYVFINENNGELPLRHIESSAIFEDFPLRNDDTNDDGISYSLISFEKENKVLTVPYRKNGQDYVVKISPDPGSQTADPIWDVLDGIEGYKIEVFRIEDDRMVEIEPEDVIVPTEKDIKDPVNKTEKNIVTSEEERKLENILVKKIRNASMGVFGSGILIFGMSLITWADAYISKVPHYYLLAPFFALTMVLIAFLYRFGILQSELAEIRPKKGNDQDATTRPNEIESNSKKFTNKEIGKKLGLIVIFLLGSFLASVLQTHFKGLNNFIDLPKSAYSASAQDTIEISPASSAWKIQGAELFLDVRWGAVSGISQDNGLNLSDYVLEVEFKEGKSANIQLYFKDPNWANVYAYPKRPVNGVVRFDPKTDECNVCDFKDFRHIYAIGYKVWGGDPRKVREDIKGVRLVRRDATRKPAKMTPSGKIQVRETRLKETVQTDRSQSMHSGKDVIEISPDVFGKKIQGPELFLDVRWGAVPGGSPDGMDLSDYVLEVEFKEGKSANIQLYFKDPNWANVYAYPKRPVNGVVRFDPKTDECNVCDFKDFRHIYAIGVKVWGGDPRKVRKDIKGVRLVRRDATRKPAKKTPSGKIQVRETRPKEVVEPGRPKKDTIDQRKKPERKEIPRYIKRAAKAAAGEIVVPLNNAWKHQTWADTRAVKKVYWDRDKNMLVGEFEIEQGHRSNDRGEVVVDVTHLGMNPFNFSDVRIEAEVKVVVEEGRFGGTPKAPDGVGIFVKTGRPGWSNMYDWENMPPDEVDKWKKIGLDLSEAIKRDMVYRDANFPSEKGEDPVIRMFGIKIGSGSGTRSKAKGKIFIRNVKIIPMHQIASIPAPEFWPEKPAQKKGMGIVNVPVNAGWTFRDVKGNKAVQAVFVRDGVLAFKVKFKGGDPFGDYNKGSIYLPLYDTAGNRLAKVPDMPKHGFFDMTGKVLRAKVWTPRSFAEGKTIPSAVVPLGKDYKFKFQNGAWQPGLMTPERTGRWDDGISYYPSDPRQNNPGWTDDEFDVTRGREIGIKVGLPGATDSSYEWEGYVYVSDVRFEPDNRRFADPVPQLTWTEPLAKNPRDKAPVSPEMFKEWSGGAGYGFFDRDLTDAGIRRLDEKFGLMSKEVKMWRHMALYGSLPPNYAIAFDKNDMPIGFADPETGKMGKDSLDKLPNVLKQMDKMLSVAKKHGKKVTLVFLAHDFADGMGGKEGRLEGDRPSLFTDSIKFARFLELQKHVLEHIRDNWRDTVVMVELINEPLNMDTTLVPIPFIQQRVHEFNMLVHKVDPTLLVSVGMRDTRSWGYFAHMTLPKFKLDDKIAKNPYYKQYVPQSHWYADKEEDTPIGTNVGRFFVPEYAIGWLKGELDPRSPREYIAAYGVRSVLSKVFKAGYMGALFWMDRPGEFWPDWKQYRGFMRNILPKIKLEIKPSGPVGNKNGFIDISTMGFIAGSGILALGGTSGQIGLALGIIGAAAIILAAVNWMTTTKGPTKPGDTSDGKNEDEEKMSKKVDIPKGEEKAPDIKTTVSGDARQEKPSQDIAEVIEYQTNNRLARMVEAGKNIAESIDDETDITFKASRENTAVEIKKYLKEIIAGIEKIEDRNIPAAIREDLDVLKGSLEDIEIDGLVAAVMTLARRAKKKNKKIAIGLETDWIPNYTKQKSMERDSVSLYVRGIGKTIEKELRKLGLGDSVIFKHETSEKLIDKLTEINNDGSTDLSEVVIMASNKTIETSKAKLDRFKIGEKEKRPFIASIDPSDIKVKGDNDGKVYTAKIMEMLSISLELAVSGKESLATSLSMVKAYNSAFRIIEFIPKIRPVDYAECVDEYKRKLKVLQAA